MRGGARRPNHRDHLQSVSLEEWVELGGSGSKLTRDEHDARRLFSGIFASESDKGNGCGAEADIGIVQGDLQSRAGKVVEAWCPAEVGGWLDLVEAMDHVGPGSVGALGFAG